MTATLAADAEHFIKIGLTGYDACYVALAKEVKGLWLTFDEKAHRLIANKIYPAISKMGYPRIGVSVLDQMNAKIYYLLMNAYLSKIFVQALG